MAILTVGSGKQFSTIAAAIAAAKNGDTIKVDAGTYTNDYALISKNITLQGVGGMVNMVSTGLIPNGKAHLRHQRQCHDQQFCVFRSAGRRSQRRGHPHQTGNLVLNNDGYFHTTRWVY